MIVEALKELKSTFNACEDSLGKLNSSYTQIRISKLLLSSFIVKLQPIKIEKNLEDYLSTLCITPKPPKTINTSDNANSVISTANIDVHSIFNESYQMTSKELTTIIKEKIKMINVK